MPAPGSTFPRLLLHRALSPLVLLALGVGPVAIARAEADGAVAAWLRSTEEDLAAGLPPRLGLPVAEPTRAQLAELTAAARHAVPAIRYQAVRALGEYALAPDLCLPVLLRALDDDDGLVRAQAVATLARFGPAAQAPLWNLLLEHRPVDANAAPGSGGRPTTAIDHAIVALRRVDQLDPAPLFESYRLALARRTWFAPVPETTTPLAPGPQHPTMPPRPRGQLDQLERLILHILGSADGPAMAGIVRYLGDSEPGLRQLARRVLAWRRFESPEVGSALGHYLAHAPEADLIAVLKSGPVAPGLAAGLERLLGQPASPAVREAAFGALARQRIDLAELARAFGRTSDPGLQAGWLTAMAEWLHLRDEQEPDATAALPVLAVALPEPALRSPALALSAGVMPLLAARDRLRLVEGLRTVARSDLPADDFALLAGALAQAGEAAKAAQPELINFAIRPPKDQEGSLPEEYWQALRVSGPINRTATKAIVGFASQGDPGAAQVLAANRRLPRRLLEDWTAQAGSDRDGDARDAADLLASLGREGDRCLITVATNPGLPEKRRDEILESVFQPNRNHRSGAELAELAELALRRQPAGKYRDFLDSVVYLHGTDRARRSAAERLRNVPFDRAEEPDQRLALIEAGLPGSLKLLARHLADAERDARHDLEVLMRRRPDLGPALLGELLPVMAALPEEGRFGLLEEIDAVVAVDAAQVPAMRNLVAAAMQAGAIDAAGSGLRVLSRAGAAVGAFLPDLLSWSRHDDATIRAECYRALGQVASENPAARARLRQGLAERDPSALDAALDSLAPKGPADTFDPAWLAACHARQAQTLMSADLDAIQHEVWADGPGYPATGSGETPLPPFPWPPPPYAHIGVFGQDLDAGLLGDTDATLGQVHRRLIRELTAVDESFVTGLFGVPNGFALLTRFERIDEEGRPLPGARRWMEGRVTPYSLRDLIMRIIMEPPGYFRILAFVFTDSTESQANRTAVLPDVLAGGKFLPPSVAGRKLSDGFAYLLVYSHVRQPGGLAEPYTRLSARSHLRQAGLTQSTP